MSRPWPLYLLGALALVVVIALMMRPSVPAAARSPDDWVAQYGGERSMYVGILASSDCDALQTRVLLSIRSGDKGYERAANDRMSAVGCFE